MKSEKGKLILVYVLIVVLLLLVGMLIYVVISSNPKQEVVETPRTIEKVDVNPYPNVSTQCTFQIDLSGYNRLEYAGCKGGYTKYDINNVVLNDKEVKVSVVYSDKNQPRTGLFINDKKITSQVDSLQNLKFGIFDNKLFVLDINAKEANTYVFDSDGEKIYDLKESLSKSKIEDKVLSQGSNVVTVNSKNIDLTSFTFNLGKFEFSTTSNLCASGNAASGSRYQVTYKGSNFTGPQFISQVNCVNQ